MSETVLIAYIIFVLVFCFCLFIYALDFITLGWIKRSKIAKFYYPIYRFFNILTLSPIYRPIYYNLIDNRFGRRMGALIIPYLLGFVLISSLTIRTHAFLPTFRFNKSHNARFYEDLRTKDNLSYYASIPSKYVDNGFLEVYLPYNPNSDDRIIQMLCPDLKPAKTGTGFDGFFFSTGDPNRYNMNTDSALTCNASRQKIYVNDSLFSNLNYRFYEHPERNNVGLHTILDVNYLSRGAHDLKIQTIFIRQRNGKDTLMHVPTGTIPFWKE